MAGYRLRIRRIALRVLLFLILGAIVNVAVAWGFAAFGPYNKSKPETLFFRPLRNEKCWYAVVEDRYIGERRFKVIIADSESVAYQFCEIWKFDYDPWTELEVPTWVRAHAISDVAIAAPKEARIFADASYGWPRSSLVYHISMTLRQFRNGDPAMTQWGFNSTTESASTGGDARYLPLLPIWSGFVANTLFYGAVIWMLFAAPASLRRWQRVALGLCPKCAYPTGTSDVCTECGVRLTTMTSREHGTEGLPLEASGRPETSGRTDSGCKGSMDKA
jgi:hypothetical protein